MSKDATPLEPLAPLPGGPGGSLWEKWARTPPVLVAVLLVAVSGVVLFGGPALARLVVSAGVAMAVQFVFTPLTGRGRAWPASQAATVGLIVACTLPPTIAWHVVILAATIAVVAGQITLGDTNSWVWHPAAVGRVVVGILFGDAFAETRWSVLAPGRLVSGNLHLARELPPLATWQTQPPPPGVEAWIVSRPVDQLSAVLPAPPDGGIGQALAQLIANGLPPWQNTLTGLAGGAIGEASVLIILAAGLMLLWLGLVRKRMVLIALLSAIAVLAIFPVVIQPANAPLTTCWLPVLARVDHLPVGLVYLAYQLTSGAFPLVLLILAADPVTAPTTRLGHLGFGLALGAGTMLLRTLTGLPAAAYWALLMGNTFVLLIDRLARSRAAPVAKPTRFPHNASVRLPKSVESSRKVGP